MVGGSLIHSTPLGITCKFRCTQVLLLGWTPSVCRLKQKQRGQPVETSRGVLVHPNKLWTYLRHSIQTQNQPKQTPQIFS